MKKYFGLIISILISQSAGIVGSIFTSQAVRLWYPTLNKPFFNPPSWIFGPVWVLLYTLMGISAYLIWQERKNNALAMPALIIFGIHLALNALWSYLFFGLQNPFLAFVEIIILWLFIAILIYLFYKIKAKAAYLLIPYLAWVSFAAVLNYYLWKLN
jgi:translocator protein